VDILYDPDVPVHPDDGGRGFLWYVGTYNTVSHPRKQFSV